MIQVHSLEELQTLQASREDNIVLLESMGFRKVAGVEEGTSKPHSVVALVANPHLFLDKFKAGYVDPSKSSYKPLIESDLSSSLIPSVELITDVARYLTPLLLKYTGNRTNIGRTLLFNRASPFPTPQKFYINILSPNDRDEGDVVLDSFEFLRKRYRAFRDPLWSDTWAYEESRAELDKSAGPFIGDNAVYLAIQGYAALNFMKNRLLGFPSN